MEAPTAGQLLREARRRHGVSQARLAIRAGTTQSSISRIERDRVSPSIDTLRELLHLLGEDLALETREHDWGIDRTQVRERMRLSSEERVAYGLEFADLVLETQRANESRPGRIVSEGAPAKAPRLAELFAPLQRQGVDFVVVGGIAGIAHGSSYPSYDLDIAYSRERANLTRLVVSLLEIGVTLRGAPPDLPFQLDVRTFENGANFNFRTTHGDFDVLADISGVRSYAELRGAAELKSIAGHDVWVASLDHLIAMKRAANRPKGERMLEDYLVIAEEQQKAADDQGE